MPDAPLILPDWILEITTEEVLDRQLGAGGWTTPQRSQGPSDFAIVVYPGDGRTSFDPEEETQDAQRG